MLPYNPSNAEKTAFLINQMSLKWKTISNNFLLKFFLFIFFIFFLFMFFYWPPISDYSDSDLFYHLSGGKFLFENHRIPCTSFFSFIEPMKSWNNYYWLFQAIVYSVYKVSGYFGLVLLRAIVFFTTIFFIWKFLQAGLNIKYFKTKYYISIIFIMTVISIFPRMLYSIRPHTFSYMLIIIFLYIFEYKKSRIWLLPFLAIFWVNVHGIEYPIVILIVLAFLIEQFVYKLVKHKSQIDISRKEKLFLISLFYCLLISPNGINLLVMPFEISPFFSQIITEMAPVSWKRLIFFNFSSTYLSGFAFQNIITISSLFSVIYLLIKKKLRIFHFILFTGGILLLFKNQRFIYEAIILFIPVIKNGIEEVLLKENQNVDNKCQLLGSICIVIIPCLIFISHLNSRSKFPITYNSVPAGIVEFLNQINVGGKIFNTPNNGGYYQWHLNSSYKIFMDLQLSLFSDLDLFNCISLMTNRQILKDTIKKYDPSFITADIINFVFENNEINYEKQEKGGSYVPVFFDDREILFVNKNHFPELVKKYELKASLPSKLNEIDYNTIKEEKLQLIVKELQRMEKIFDKSLNVNLTLCKAAIKRENYDRAMIIADKIIQFHPSNYNGYFLKGQVYLEKKNYSEAIKYFKKALKKSNGHIDKTLFYNLHVAYSKTNDFKNAYKILRKSINVFEQDTRPDDLYTLGLLAILIKNPKLSDKYLSMAALKVSENDIELKEKIRKMRNE